MSTPAYPPPTRPNADVKEFTSEELGRPRTYLALLALTIVVFVFSLNVLPLTDPDEVFYAQTAREMIDARSPLTPLLFGHPQFEKPPLTYWALMASFKVFGLKPFAARLVPALFGFLGALATFFFARRFVSETTAALAAAVQATGMLYLGQSIALLTDMVLTSLMATSFYCFYIWFRTRKSAWLHAFAAFAALGVLAKGPIGMIITALGIVFFLRFQRENTALRAFLLHPWWLTFLIIALPWNAWAAIEYGRAFWWEFFVHDNWHRILWAEHTNFDNQGFYPAVIIAGMLPWTPLLVFLGAGVRKHRELSVFLLGWIGVTFALFAICHSKLASYILPLFPALALLLALSLEEMTRARRRRVVAAAIFAVIGAGLLAVPALVNPAMLATFRAPLIAVSAFGAAELVVALLLLRRRFAPALVLNGAAFLAVVCIACLAPPANAEVGFTDAGLPAVVAQQGFAGQPVVASKLYARGVRFHAGNPVVVIDRRKNPFWSDHPIDVIASDDEIRAYFNARERVLCVIRSGDAHRLDDLFRGERRSVVLSDAFERVVLISEARPKR